MLLGLLLILFCLLLIYLLGFGILKILTYKFILRYQIRKEGGEVFKRTLNLSPTIQQSIVQGTSNRIFPIAKSRFSIHFIILSIRCIVYFVTLMLLGTLEVQSHRLAFKRDICYIQLANIGYIALKMQVTHFIKCWRLDFRRQGGVQLIHCHF